MNEFLVAIHVDLMLRNQNDSGEQMEEVVTSCEDWIAAIAARDKLVAPPRRWRVEGWVLIRKKLCDGAYAEEMITIDGLLLIKAKDYDWAVEMAKGYPMTGQETVVEVCMTIRAA